MEEVGAVGTNQHELHLILVRTKPRAGGRWVEEGHQRPSIGPDTRAKIERQQARNVGAMHLVAQAARKEED